MDHRLLQNASFGMFLLSVDQDLARTACQEGCRCGGHLHRANYPRKPRGGPQGLPPTFGFRLSFCCDRAGCRKRVTPPSVRFLGRKVYLHGVILLVAAMRQGANLSHHDRVVSGTGKQYVLFDHLVDLKKSKCNVVKRRLRHTFEDAHKRMRTKQGTEFSKEFDMEQLLF